ncbi:MAG: pseudaminic acid cytidylyltransferase [Bacteroidetes bacterium]|nr:MAG: pseudaminic acid cytidylyltransferase [Bacteroidota bacterium]
MAKLAIIPARGGSKRIPGKNIRDFLGKPIISYSIETALKSDLFDTVMVSTDDEKIAELARAYGAEVPFLRSPKNSDDHATTMDVIHEVVREYAEKGKHFEHLCCIYPTSPLTKMEDLKQGFEMISTDRYDTVFPIVAFSYPIWRGIYLDDKGNSCLISEEHADKRSQDTETVYHDAGQWYWINQKKEVHSILDSKKGHIILSQLDVQDIDEPSDWQIAELKFKLQKRDNN